MMFPLKTDESDSPSYFDGEIANEAVDIAPLAHNLDDEKKRTVDIQPVSHEMDSATVKSADRLPESVRFSDLQVSPPILRGLTEAGFSRPSPVQMKAIPFGRMGMDLIVQAKSGTGKTVVFAVVLLEAVDTQRPALQALVLAPTREIALQSQNVLERLGAHLPGLKCRLFVGGLPLADNLKHLQECHIAVGTPGRVRYLIETGYMSTEHIRHLVLDEADLLLAGGAEANVTGGSANNAFPADINYIWWSLSSEKQMIALSATYTDYLVEEHLQRYMNNPVLVRLAAHDPALLGVRQFFAVVEPTNRSPAAVFAAKISCLCKLLSSVDFQQCLIFSNFHSSAQELCDALHSRGWPVGYISSNLDQSERFRAFNRLRAFHCRVLVSTDLTSRGIDAENVNLVVSLEVPWEHEIYLHRVGRAGRFGSYGASVLIVANVEDEMNLLRKLQSRCPTKIRKLPEPTPADLAAPDCPVDLSSLVTVVNCAKKPHNQKQELPSHLTTSSSVNSSAETANFLNSVDQDKPSVPCLLKNGHARPDHGSPKCPASLWSQLSKEMNIYLHQAVQSIEGLDKERNQNTTALSIDVMEKKMLKSLEALYSVDLPSISSEETKLATTEGVPPKGRNFPPPLREPPKHVDDSNIAAEATRHLGQEFKTSASEQGDPIPWTQRQIAAWYEYFRLINHAYWYRASWELAVNEYHDALERWKALNVYSVDRL